MDLVILDELGYLPFSQAGGALLFHLLSKLYAVSYTHLDVYKRQQFSLLALKMILLAAPAVLGTSWLLRRYPPRWRRETVLRIVCVLLLATGVSIAASALLGR